MKMYDSSKAFAAALNRIVGQFELEAGDVTRKAAVDLASKVIKDTPYDTGRAQASWNLTPDTPSGDVPPPGDYPQDPPVGNPGKSLSFRYWLVSNLEYIQALEDGHSKGQAPNGMVANAMNAFTDNLNKQLNGMDTITK